MKLVSKMERLPSLPALYSQVTAELAKPEASIQFAGRLISKDPAMTARILQMVNSSFFALAVPIVDPVAAVLHLGVERTKAMILLADVFLRFENDACAGFSHDQLWRHSMAVGAFARAVAHTQTKNLAQSETAYTAGLLHDVGMLLLAANLPEEYSQVLEQAQRRELPIREVEMEAFNTSHAEVGARVLESWGLPTPILDAIAWHHCPSESGDREFSLLTAVHVANAVEQEKMLYRVHKLVNQMDTPYIQRLGLGDRRSAWRQTCGLPVLAVPEKEPQLVPLRAA